MALSPIPRASAAIRFDHVVSVLFSDALLAFETAGNASASTRATRPTIAAVSGARLGLGFIGRGGLVVAVFALLVAVVVLALGIALLVVALRVLGLLLDIVGGSSNVVRDSLLVLVLLVRTGGGRLLRRSSALACDCRRGSDPARESQNHREQCKLVRVHAASFHDGTCCVFVGIAKSTARLNWWATRAGE